MRGWKVHWTLEEGGENNTLLSLCLSDSVRRECAHEAGFDLRGREGNEEK
jgi:hypothetical protein